MIQICECAPKRRIVVTAACLPFRRQHRQHSCRQVLHHWRSICTVRALLQQQGRAVTCSLQLLRLKQAWQLWRRAHRAALAARQRQYSKMVYELLKVSDTGHAMFWGMLVTDCKLVCDPMLWLALSHWACLTPLGVTCLEANWRNS